MYACIIYDIMCVWLKYYKSIKYIIIAVFLPERNTSRIAYIYDIYICLPRRRVYAHDTNKI